MLLKLVAWLNATYPSKKWTPTKSANYIFMLFLYNTFLNFSYVSFKRRAGGLVFRNSICRWHGLDFRLKRADVPNIPVGFPVSTGVNLRWG